jgi:hypothetical protein
LKEIAAAKQIVKPQESASAPKAVKETGGPIAHVFSVESKAGVGSSVEAATPSSMQVVATVAAIPNDTGTTKQRIGAAVDQMVKPPIEVVTATAVGAQAAVSKGMAHDERANVSDIGTALPLATDQEASTKFGSAVAKISPVAVPVERSGDSSTQGASGPIAAVIHAVSGAAGASTGTQGIVVPGNSLDVTSARVPTGDAVAHATGLPIGPREQDGAGLLAAPPDGMPRMLAATPTSLEVGIQNGTHGWLKVRAEMAEGGLVNASVSAASPTETEMLHRELPALTAYLQAEKVAVNAVVVHAASNAGGEGRSFSGADGGGGQTPQRSNEGDGRSQRSGDATGSDADAAMTYQGVNEVDGEGSLPLAAFGGGGGWLSVRA